MLSALLHSNRFDREYQIKHGDYNRPTSEVLRREVDEWASIQKPGYGTDWLVEEYKEHMMRIGGVTPTTMIIPSKMAQHLTMADPIKTQYMYAGEGGVKMLKDGPSALTSFRGVNVFKAHAFDVYEGELPIDLLSRDMQIGEFYTMKDTTNDHKKKYSSSQRDIIIYDENIDDWRRISFSEAIENCARFDEDGNLADADSGTDMFTDDKGDNLTYFRQMNLAASEVHKMADTMAFNALNEVDLAALNNGMAMVDGWCRVGVPSDVPTLVAADAVFEQTDFKIAAQLTADEIPANRGGCCNWVMLNLIASSSTDEAEKLRAAELVRVVRVLYDMVVTRYPNVAIVDNDNPFLMAYVTPEEQALATFFTHCVVGTHFFNYWSWNTGANDGQGSSAAADDTDEEVKARATLLKDLKDVIVSKGKGASETNLFDFLRGGDANMTELALKIKLQRIFDKPTDGEDFKAYFTAKQFTRAQAASLRTKVRSMQNLPGNSASAAPRVVAPTRNIDGSEFVTPYTATNEAGKDISTSMYFFPLHTTGRLYGKVRELEDIASRYSHYEGLVGDDNDDMFSSRKRARNDGVVSWSDERKRQRNSSRIRDYLNDMDSRSDYYIASNRRIGAPNQGNLGETDTSANLQQVVDRMANDRVKFAFAKAFLYAKITRGAIMSMIKHNIYVPFAVLLARPYMTYSMSSAVMMKGGYDTGATYVGHSDFQLGDDVASKVHCT